MKQPEFIPIDEVTYDHCTELACFDITNSTFKNPFDDNPIARIRVMEMRKGYYRLCDPIISYSCDTSKPTQITSHVSSSIWVQGQGPNSEHWEEICHCENRQEAFDWCISIMAKYSRV